MLSPMTPHAMERVPVLKPCDAKVHGPLTTSGTVDLIFACPCCGIERLVQVTPLFINMASRPGSDWLDMVFWCGAIYRTPHPEPAKVTP